MDTFIICGYILAFIGFVLMWLVKKPQKEYINFRWEVTGYVNVFTWGKLFEYLVFGSIPFINLFYAIFCVALTIARIQTYEYVWKYDSLKELFTTPKWMQKLNNFLKTPI